MLVAHESRSERGRERVAAAEAVDTTTHPPPNGASCVVLGIPKSFSDTPTPATTLALPIQASGGCVAQG
jgi:hypothetical protein